MGEHLLAAGSERGARGYCRPVRVTRTGVVVLVALLASATACGAGADTASTATAVQNAVSKSATATGSKTVMSAKLRGEDLYAGEFAGSKDGRNGRGWVSLPSLNSTIHYDAVAGALYYAFPNLPAGKKWVKLTQPDLQSIGIGEAALQQQQTKQILALVKAPSSEVRLIGDQQVNGKAATHYHVVVRAHDLAHQSEPPAQPAAALSLFGPTTPVEVWIGEDGRVRRITYTIDLSKSQKRPKGFPAHGTLAYRFDLSDYGVVSTPTVPSPGQIMSYSDLQALLASTGTGTN